MVSYEKQYTDRQAAKILKKKIKTLQKIIQRGKIQSKKDENGCHLVPESEIQRYLREQEKIESGDYLCSKDLVDRGIPKDILYDGSVETVILHSQYYVKWDELKRWINLQPDSQITEDESHQKTVFVVNHEGIHFRPASAICEICSKHYKKHRTICNIFHNHSVWIYPSHGVVHLLKMEIQFHEKLTIKCFGENSQKLLSDLVKAFQNQFFI